ncbi:D-3-phosphoglycerate dehydrogenase [Levilactobacillus spicheri DSM 15429]|uniref:D-3-phosphoglycerate dehydrogenase n=2 Tax=Levilactobacillus spicheri TaxID=216463 RepID=A0A0R1QQV9_9LACO|nr:phosphoglycerate dehydrogenase [Levilactobacillus spicheri]KRL46844.1 D-3-phosphoglycerate dehydrogenase [Levilactobacillus spicheri DSM 15429]
MMTKTVAIPRNLAQAGKDYLTQHGMTLVELDDMSTATIAQQAKEVDGIVLMTDPFGNELADQMPNLKVIARHGVGYDNVDQDFWGQQGVWVTITPNANAATVAETALAEMLDLSKDLTGQSTAMRRGDGQYKVTHLGFDLAGKSLGIMGFGRIGRALGKLVQSLNMRVLIYDPFVQQTDLGELVDRDTLLRESDVISLHMAVTPENKQGIGEREFAMMKDSAYLVNLGRGALVDQAALIAALKAHTIAGAALDVFDEEPLPLNSPFFSLDNALLTPHIASNTREAMDRMAVDSASEVVRVLQGQTPQWAVNQVQ